MFGLLKKEETFKDLLLKHWGGLHEKWFKTSCVSPLKLNWAPIVLFIGGYSSGKSSLLNRCVGKEIQKVGQAPTDDSFTIMIPLKYSFGLAVGDYKGDSVIFQKDSPFQILQKMNEKFFNYCVVKVIDIDIECVMIDSPGFLGGSKQTDRPYDIYEVLDFLCEISDKILFLMDVHKAGTVVESLNFLEYLFTQHFYDDKIQLILSRMDEVDSLSDLIRVYGSLCWQISPLLNRKDIIPIYFIWENERRTKDENLEKFIHNDLEYVVSKVLYSQESLEANVSKTIRIKSRILEAVLESLHDLKRKSLFFVLKSFFYFFVFCFFIGILLALLWLFETQIYYKPEFRIGAIFMSIMILALCVYLFHFFYGKFRVDALNRVLFEVGESSDFDRGLYLEFENILKEHYFSCYYLFLMKNVKRDLKIVRRFLEKLHVK